MKNKIEEKFGYLLAGAALIGLLLVSGTALAAGPGPGQRGMGRTPGVFGTVTAISGTSLTVTSHGFGQNQNQTTYTVDATNATVTKNGSASSVGNIAVGDQVMVQGTVNGTNVTATTIRDGMMGRGMNGNGVFGTVASVSGNTITVTATMGSNGGSGTTYTVDATNAAVTKNGASSSVSNIAVGDKVMVQGTVSGSNVTATAIRDGTTGNGTGRGLGNKGPGSSAIPQGNGQPVTGGSVAAINGSTLTVSNKSNVTYTVDASNATIIKNGATSTLSSISVGDNVVVQGATNGSSVTASSIIDHSTPPANNPSQNNGNSAPATNSGHTGGFLGGIANFFHKLFGFF